MNVYMFPFSFAENKVYGSGMRTFKISGNALPHCFWLLQHMPSWRLHQLITLEAMHPPIIFVQDTKKLLYIFEPL